MDAREWTIQMLCDRIDELTEANEEFSKDNQRLRTENSKLTGLLMNATFANEKKTFELIVGGKYNEPKR